MKQYISLSNVPIRTITVNGVAQKIVKGNVDIEIGGSGDSKINSITVNGVPVPIENKVAKITFPISDVKGIKVEGSDEPLPIDPKTGTVTIARVPDDEEIVDLVRDKLLNWSE